MDFCQMIKNGLKQNTVSNRKVGPFKKIKAIEEASFPVSICKNETKNRKKQKERNEKKKEGGCNVLVDKTF